MNIQPFFIKFNASDLLYHFPNYVLVAVFVDLHTKNSVIALPMTYGAYQPVTLCGMI